MSEPICLIVNADDFGLSEGVNRGIIEAHESGIVTSASLMVRHPGASDAAARASAHPQLSVGLHFDLAEARFCEEEWRKVYQLVDLEDADAVRAEFERQWSGFEQLMGKQPTHVDSHQHIHRKEPIRSLLLQKTRAFGIPLRDCEARIRFSGSFYGQTDEGAPFPAGVSEANLIRLLKNLAPGWTELGCHPGYANGVDSVYAGERELELRALCGNAVREALPAAEIRLRSFADFSRSAN